LASVEVAKHRQGLKNSDVFKELWAKWQEVAKPADENDSG